MNKIDRRREDKSGLRNVESTAEESSEKSNSRVEHANKLEHERFRQITFGKYS